MREPVSRPFIDLSRREAMAGAILLVAGLAVGPAACSRPLDRGFFPPAQMRVLEELCETILPQTDTPGARAAKVHVFIDGMMTSWASEATRDAMRVLLDRIDHEAGGGFAKMTPVERTDFLGRFDAAAFAAKDKAWAQLKKLVVLGYYSSEIGATQELAYLPVPGDWRPDVPVGPNTRAWAE